MKKTFLSLFTALALFSSPASAAGETIHVKILGLVCEFCAKTLEKVFLGTGKVETLAVDLDSALVTIVTKEGEMLDDATITKHVTDSGYTVENIHHMTEKAGE